MLEPGESLANQLRADAGRKPLGCDIADAAAFANKPGMGWTVHMENNDQHGEHVSTTWKVRSRQETGCRRGCCVCPSTKAQWCIVPISQ